MGITNKYASAYLRRHWAPCREWPTATLLSWMQWFIDHDRTLFVTDKGRLICVALYRLVRSSEEAEIHYEDNGGPLVYIEVTAASHAHGMKAAFNLLRQKLDGKATHIAWVRGKHNNRPFIATFDRAAAHLTYG